MSHTPKRALASMADIRQSPSPSLDSNDDTLTSFSIEDHKISENVTNDNYLDPQKDFEAVLTSPSSYQTDLEDDISIRELKLMREAMVIDDWKRRNAKRRSKQEGGRNFVVVPLEGVDKFRLTHSMACSLWFGFFLLIWLLKHGSASLAVMSY